MYGPAGSCPVVGYFPKILPKTLFFSCLATFQKSCRRHSSFPAFSSAFQTGRAASSCESASTTLAQSSPVAAYLRIRLAPSSPTSTRPSCRPQTDRNSDHILQTTHIPTDLPRARQTDRQTDPKPGKTGRQPIYTYAHAHTRARARTCMHADIQRTDGRTDKDMHRQTQT